MTAGNELQGIFICLPDYFIIAFAHACKLFIKTFICLPTWVFHGDFSGDPVCLRKQAGLFSTFVKVESVAT
jgi:hypothetical protein